MGGETLRLELLKQAHQRTVDSRVAKLNVEPEEQNEFNLKQELEPLYASFGDDGDGSGFYGFPLLNIDTNGLWLEIFNDNPPRTNVSNTRN